MIPSHPFPLSADFHLKSDSLKKGRLILCIALLPLFLFSCHVRHDAGQERLLATLDKDLARKTEYLILRQSHIDTLKRACSLAPTDSARYALSLQLTDEYLTFHCDSALAYALQSRHYANRTNDIYRQQEADIRILRACSNAGMFSDIPRLVHLRGIDDVIPDHRASYCWAMIGLFEHMRSYYAGNDERSTHFNRLTLLYRDTLMQILPPRAGYGRRKGHSASRHRGITTRRSPSCCLSTPTTNPAPAPTVSMP